MKKIWKQEWKYYLFFILATILCMYLLGNTLYIRPFFEGWMVDSLESATYDEDIFWRMDYLAGDVEGLMLHLVVIVVAIFLLLAKGFQWWLEKEEYSRCFLQFLPIKRRERSFFHLLMDSLLIIVPVSAYALFLYAHYSRELQTMNVDIPWLFEAICGEAVTSICYLLMLLGLLYFLEIIFVNGFIKILGSVSGIGMLAYMLNVLFTRNCESMLIQNLYGFFTLESVGNCYYDSIDADSLFAEAMWLHVSLKPPIFYKGELLEWREEDVFESLTVSRFFDFSHPSSYLGYAVAYMVLAIILIGFAIWLSEKRELSKEVFYFSFGKYLFSAMICGTFYAFTFISKDTLWHKWFVWVADLALFVLLIYAMTPKEEQGEPSVIQ